MVQSLYELFIFGENVLALLGILTNVYSVLEGTMMIKDAVWARFTS